MGFRRYAIALAAIGIAWALISLVAMTYGTLVVWPDYVHTNFGVPFTFAIHTTNTIAGPVDSWEMDVNALLADLAFWLVGMVAILMVGLAGGIRSKISTTMHLP